MRRSDHPNRPSAITCCFLSSLNTLITLTQGNSRVRINVLDKTSRWRFSSDNHWPHLSDYRGEFRRLLGPEFHSGALVGCSCDYGAPVRPEVPIPETCPEWHIGPL